MQEKEQRTAFSWSTHGVRDVFDALKTGTSGLSDADVSQRLETYGENRLPQRRPASPFRLFFDQFTNPLMAILLIAGLVSAFLSEWLDVGVILFAVLINVILGFIEEFKADRSLEALNNYLPEQVRVRRNGQVRTLSSSEVVPGDIILLQTGDKVTADGRLIEVHAMEVDEAPLTGESQPVRKTTDVINGEVSVSDQVNMVFAGTIVVAGRGAYVVTETGQKTEIGEISRLVSHVGDEDTPLQNQLKEFARVIGAAVLVLAAIVMLVGIWRGQEVVEMFQVAVAISVSAVPEGLVVAMTVILAVGMQRILKRKALVRRLIGAETLGSVSVICMDKTGTLTTGEMAVMEVRGDEARLKDILWTMNTAERDGGESYPTFLGSPTEVAMANFSFHKDRSKDDVIDEVPFDSSRKFKAALVSADTEQVLAVGAPDVLFERLSDSQDRGAWEKDVQEMVEKGLRVILVAQKKVESLSSLSPEDVHGIEVVGLVGLEDPLRDTAKETVERARVAGLRPVMITGDHPKTAFVIASRVGLADDPDEVVTGKEIDKMTDAALARKIENLSVFARVLPRHKLRLVQAWKAQDVSVAMIGDGVNDAPAMKAADIGVALGSGTEVTKEAADMVLLDDNFKTIIAAIREGRVMFDNIRKVIVYLLSDSFTEIILIIAALLLAIPLPILPAQILWINLVKDGFSSLALTFEPGEDGVMQESPRQKGERLLNSEMMVIIFVVGIVTDILLLGIYLWMTFGLSLPLNEIRTFIFAALGMSSLLYVFAIRTFRASIFHSNPFQNRWLLAGVALGFFFLLFPILFTPLRNAFNFVPLTGMEWVVVGGLGVVNLVLIELVKYIFIVRQHRQVEAGA